LKNSCIETCIFVGRLAEVKISRLLSLRRKFLYDLTVKGEEERGDALQEMERPVNLCVSLILPASSALTFFNLFHFYISPRRLLKKCYALFLHVFSVAF
jgi:hypothetical protein